MESIVKTARNASGRRIKSYPKRGQLMNSGKMIVMATGYGNRSIGYPCFSGVVIVANQQDGEDMPIGFYSRTWTLDAFEKTDFKIQLH